MPSNLENKTSDEHHHMTYHTVSLFITALKKLHLVISGHVNCRVISDLLDVCGNDLNHVTQTSTFPEIPMYSDIYRNA